MLCGEMGERGGIGILADCIRQGRGGCRQQGEMGMVVASSKRDGWGKKEAAVGKDGRGSKGRPL